MSPADPYDIQQRIEERAMAMHASMSTEVWTKSSKGHRATMRRTAERQLVEEGAIPPEDQRSLSEEAPGAGNTCQPTTNRSAFSWSQPPAYNELAALLLGFLAAYLIWGHHWH